jgi:hypothetical protein
MKKKLKTFLLIYRFDHLAYAFVRKNPENSIWMAITGAVSDTAMLGSDAIMDKMWPRENAAFAMIISENKNTTKFIPSQPNLTML